MGYGCGGGEEGGGGELLTSGMMGRKGKAILAKDWRGIMDELSDRSCEAIPMASAMPMLDAKMPHLDSLHLFPFSPANIMPFLIYSALQNSPFTPS